MQKFIIVFIVTTLLSACSLMPQKLPPSEQMTPQETPLLAASLLGETVQVTQKLLIRKGNDQHQMLAVLLVSDTALTLTGFNSLGQQLILIRYENNQLSVERSPWFPASIPARQILAQLQLAYWPLEHLQTAYPAPWHVEATPKRRVFLQKQKPIMTINYSALNLWDSTITLKHNVLDYELRVETVALQKLPPTVNN